jgi:uncharacterized protein
MPDDPSPSSGQALPPFVRGLLRPAAFAHPAEPIELRETHISWVVLAGRYAYKIKKPVDFGFLDFSDPERRAQDCRDEVALNRRLCPDVYLGVTHVTERAGQYFMGGRGTQVEPVVRMRRLPEDGMLPNLLARDAATPTLVRRIAGRLAEFHARAATGAGVDEHGRLAAVRGNWDENFRQLEPFVGRTVSAHANSTIRAYVAGFLAEHEALFSARVAGGRIRDGHGDLHAASICARGRKVWLFDCLEFSPRFRCADVAAEVAFLAMDLDHYGRADLAATFVQTYERASGDEELRRLLPFYACYRAYVRGKVRSLRLAEPGLSSRQAAATEDEARSYFDLAWAYAGGLARPSLLVVMGLPASGKTTLVRALAGRLGLVHVSSDVVRKELAGLRPTERRRDRFGEGLYGPAASRRTYATMRRRAARWLRRGRSVVLDATFGSPAERAALGALARRLGATLLVVECRADEAELRRRLLGREWEGTTASDARSEIWSELRAAYAEPRELADVLRVDATAALEQQVRTVLDRLPSSTPTSPTPPAVAPGPASGTRAPRRG